MLKLKHSREYWDIVPLDRMPTNRAYDKSFRAEKEGGWRWFWRQKYITLIRQASEYINTDMMYSRQAGWR